MPEPASSPRGTTDRPLIVDVGMHRGDDTAFYLAKGFDVLAIEADPDLVDQGRRRFADDIAASRLEIVHVAVAEAKGTRSFHTSSREGWGSLDPARAGGALGADVRSVEVAADTFDGIVSGHRTPYYVKIDIEGADALCVEGLCRLPDPPRFMSFEADLADPEGCSALLTGLAGVGYRGFKMVNQALNPRLTPPNPPREGRYVPARFTHEMSGLFGAETPGEWRDVESVRASLLAAAHQQRARSTYATTGRLWGIPVGSLHGVLRAVYNAPPVTRARLAYARSRGRESGGWFDVHATLGP